MDFLGFFLKNFINRTLCFGASYVFRQVNDLEFAQVEIKVMEGLKGGNEALAELHKIMTLDDVEKIMGDTEVMFHPQVQLYVSLSV